MRLPAIALRTSFIRVVLDDKLPSRGSKKWPYGIIGFSTQYRAECTDIGAMLLGRREVLIRLSAIALRMPIIHAVLDKAGIAGIKKMAVWYNDVSTQYRAECTDIGAT